MPYSYKIQPTSSPLTAKELYKGRLVCLSTVTTNPNDVGILELSKEIPGSDGVWTAIINGVRRNFNANGAEIKNGVYSTTPILYGVLSNTALDPTPATSITRSSTVPGESNEVSLTYMTPKDYFACEALNAFIISYKNPLSIDDGTIALMVAKCYKIAQAMAIEAYESRQNDKESNEQSGTHYVDVDETSLQTNTDRVLYNINESIKANTNALVNSGIKVSNIDEVEVVTSTSNPIHTKEVS